MIASRLRWLVAIFILLLLIIPAVSAQEDDEDQAASEDTCIVGTFCGIMIFIFFLIYISVKKKPRDSQEIRGTSTQRYPPRQPGVRYPQQRPYPPPMGISHPRQPPQPKDIKCDLCGSKNLRHFEHGYAKCKDCKHVIYTLKKTRNIRR
jgi:hypothetical protein